MEITISKNNKKVEIKTPVKDSLHASLLADQLNKLPYLKVENRKFENQHAIITAYIIISVFNIDKFYDDLDELKGLTLKTKDEHESNKN